MNIAETLARVILIGIGATVVMDVWLMILKHMGVQTLNFAFIGRWVGHLFRGRFAHRSIAQAPTIAGEMTWGWLTHYTVGIVFAGLLVAAQGIPWMESPSVGPAIVLGFCTVVIPLFVMQPAMGLGVAASRTSTPLKNCLRSMANHTIFGGGLYLSAVVIEWISR